MKVVLFGIYKIGVEALTALVERHINVVAVVTKADTPAERQPVAEAAIGHGLTLLTPESPRQAAFLEQVQAFAPDLIVVAGYHKIFPDALLEIPPRGAINLHLSLLP